MTAAVRKTPTQANGGVDDGIDYTNDVDAEIEALWKGAAFGWLTSIGGTANAVTATSGCVVGRFAAPATTVAARRLVPSKTSG